jgi:hypothetical protein
VDANAAQIATEQGFELCLHIARQGLAAAAQRIDRTFNSVGTGPAASSLTLRWPRSLLAALTARAGCAIPLNLGEATLHGEIADRGSSWRLGASLDTTRRTTCPVGSYATYPACVSLSTRLSNQPFTRTSPGAHEYAPVPFAPFNSG